MNPELVSRRAAVVSNKESLFVNPYTPERDFEGLISYLAVRKVGSRYASGLIFIICRITRCSSLSS